MECRIGQDGFIKDPWAYEEKKFISCGAYAVGKRYSGVYLKMIWYTLSICRNKRAKS